MLGFRVLVEAFNFILQVCLGDFLSERDQRQEDEAGGRLFGSWDYAGGIRMEAG